MPFRILKYFIFMILFLTLIMLSSYSYIIRCIFIDFRSFHAIEKNLYISNTLNEQSRIEIVALLEDAKNRIKKQYGEVHASPMVIVITSDFEAKDYNLIDSPAICYFTPWQNYLILNFNKKSIDVVSHELVHTEIAHRLGYFKRYKEIPTWFDEGIAMQVDFRQEYTIDPTALDKAEISRILELTSPNKFWSKNKNQNIKNYQISKALVTMMLKNSSSQSIYTLLDRIKNGEKFEKVFSLP